MGLPVYTNIQDIRTVPMNNILTLVDPTRRTGHVYTSSKKEITTPFGSFELSQKSNKKLL